MGITLIALRKFQQDIVCLKDKKVLLYCYQSSRVWPQQGSFCLVSLKPIEWDSVRFRSKGKLYSLIKERRGGSLHTRAHVLPMGGAALYGLVSRGWGTEEAEFSRGSRAAVLLTGQIQGRGQRLCARPTCTVLNRGVLCSSAHGPPSWGGDAAILLQELWSEALSVRPLHTVPYRQVRLVPSYFSQGPQWALPVTLVPEKEQTIMDQSRPVWGEFILVETVPGGITTRFLKEKEQKWKRKVLLFLHFSLSLVHTVLSVHFGGLHVWRTLQGGCWSLAFTSSLCYVRFILSDSLNLIIWFFFF